MMTRVTLIVAIVFVVRPLTGYSAPTTSKVETVVAHHLASAERGRCRYRSKFSGEMSDTCCGCSTLARRTRCAARTLSSFATGKLLPRLS
jgi:hypothetical protein